MERKGSDPDARSRGVNARGLTIAVVAPLAAAVGSIPLSSGGPASAIAVFMLAIVIAAVAGGLWSGLIAAILSSLAVSMLFSTPRFTLQFDGAEDVVTAVVFLAVAIVVGLLVGGASEERARAARREREARLLGYLSSKLLTGEVPDRVLDDFAFVLLDPFALASCEVTVELDGQQLRASAARPEVRAGGPQAILPLVVGAVAFGTVVVERAAGGHAFTADELLLLEAAAKQAAAALDRARLDARARMAQLDAETNQLRAAMFSSVTHDLRTPLTSIKAGVTSLLDPSVHYDVEQERELLTTILEETDRLNRLVGNILDLSKIRAGALIPTRQAAAIEEITEAVVARLAPRLPKVQIRSELGEELPEVQVDPMQIDQVLTNLIENAARHSPTGGTVKVSVETFDGRVQIRVRDHGPGIALEERERVFEAFYRGRTNPETPGSGLGLAIVKAIVVAHGGSIRIEEAPGGGAVVIVEISVEGEAVD